LRADRCLRAMNLARRCSRMRSARNDSNLSPMFVDSLPQLMQLSASRSAASAAGASAPPLLRRAAASLRSPTDMLIGGA
jgi:hypothetical protein